MQILKSLLNSILLFFVLAIYSCQSTNEDVVIPKSCGQSILVLTDSLEATKGSLYYFERDSTETSWKMVDQEIPVVLGRNGLGWGRGIHDSSNIFNYPIKKEGDGKSPAGVFNISFVFGFKSEEEISSLKMPYLHVTDMIECIDDVNSEYYNQIVNRDEIENIDWKSSEKMNDYDIYYKLGVVIDHNSNPITNEGGSCIFLHNWSNPNETMAGCTAMEPVKMKKIVEWLNFDMQPVLVQLTKQSYNTLVEEWELPQIK